MQLLTTMQVTSMDFDPVDVSEYGPGDREYDWGYAEDGFPVPRPCPIDNTPYGACVHHPNEEGIL